MLGPGFWALKGTAPSEQLDQTPVTESVGAGQEPRYQVSILLEILQTNLTGQQKLQTVCHGTSVKILSGN